MRSSILSLATAVPELHFSQSDLAERMIELFSFTGLAATKLRKLYQNSGIEKRHATRQDVANHTTASGLWKPNFLECPPSSSEINAIYKIEAPKLAIKAASECLRIGEIAPSSITHVISISCTGMMAPGIEFSLMDALELKRNVTRYGINFMGCFGAFKGLGLADSIVKEDPTSRVLVVCTELCSLHLQPSTSIEAAISNALFADGSAAVVVGGPHATKAPLWEIAKKKSLGLSNSLDKMGWEIGDHGFIMRLTKDVPDIFSKEIPPFINQLTDKEPLDIDWAIHPGGRSIVEKLQEVLSLSSDQTSASWNTLKNYGNMSSCTFLFVLEEILRQGKKNPLCVGVSMGPGLSLEGILLKNVS